MVRQGYAAVALVMVGFARDPGCGGIDAPNGGTNAPCTRSSDCAGGRVCLEGVCREPDGDPVPNPDVDSGGPEDAGDGGG